MKSLYTSLLVFCAVFAFAQNISGIQEQSLHYLNMGTHADVYWDSVRIAEGAPANVQPPITVQGACTLNKRVFGWHPYWVGTVYNNYQWNLLSDLCYFDYSVSPNTGSNTNASYNWSGSGAVTAAIANGVNVHICATLFSSHSTFLASTSAQQTFVNNIIADLQARGGKGVNIDFEGMVASNSAPFTAFMQNLSIQIHAAIPGSEVSMALYAVDWGNVFDIPALTPYVDLFIIMGYDYYWSGSTTAGPDDPLYVFQTSYPRTLTSSIDFYLAQGMPTNKLLLGLPYYGREWETTASTIPSATTGNFSSSRTFNTIMNNASGYYTTPRYDPVSFTPYYSFQVSAAWRQCWWENPYSMKRRFDVVNQRNLGGIGIWALGYDDGYSDYWDAISERFSDCAQVACSDTLWDMGGPSRNYFDDEDYVTTIAPSGATQVTLTFSQFNMELNFDSVFIYDGPNETYPLIGAYTGANSPGTITSTGSALAIRVHTDGNTTTAGFTAIWSCAIDNTPPTTLVNGPPGWVTQNFQASFADADVGSGVEKSYYQVADNNGTDWRANDADGFLNDDFNGSVINPQWTPYQGIWSINSGALEQSDESNANTSLSSPLTQNLSNRYLYHWQGAISGSGNNRRAGLHFFADNASLPNRGNGYFVWFRVDQSELQFYEVTNDVFTLRASYPMTVNAGQWYDWKVVYERITGKMEVYQNNMFIGAWTDSTPYSNGNCVSLRSGNCNWQVDNFHVYRSRYNNATVNVTVGNCATCDVRYQNPSPNISSCLIRSINRDSAMLFSNIYQRYVDVDWTVANFSMPLDGNAADIDTTTNPALIEGNWANAVDTNSGIANYWFCIGTTAGDSDFVAWTNNAWNTFFSVPVSLSVGQWYYIGLRVENGAGLITPMDTSNGQVLDLGLGIQEQVEGWNIYPNPAVNQVTLESRNTAWIETINIYDAHGRLALSMPAPINASLNAPIVIDISALASGTYTLQITNGVYSAFTLLIKQ
jgi:spore germination protein YaaH